MSDNNNCECAELVDALMAIVVKLDNLDDAHLEYELDNARQFMKFAGYDTGVAQLVSILLRGNPQPVHVNGFIY